MRAAADECAPNRNNPSAETHGSGENQRRIPIDTAIAKDPPLTEDTRLLGRVIGDVLRAQTGEAVFARIEAVRGA